MRKKEQVQQCDLKHVSLKEDEIILQFSKPAHFVRSDKEVEFSKTTIILHIAIKKTFPLLAVIIFTLQE